MFLWIFSMLVVTLPRSTRMGDAGTHPKHVDQSSGGAQGRLTLRLASGGVRDRFIPEEWK